MVKAKTRLPWCWETYLWCHSLLVILLCIHNKGTKRYIIHKRILSLYGVCIDVLMCNRVFVSTSSALRLGETQSCTS